MKAARWQRRKDERPAEVLDAALLLFGEKGFARTRMDDIAARAGVSKGTLYLYFESKEDIFRALVREAIVPNLTFVEAAVEAHQGASADLLRLMILRVGQMIHDQRLSIKVIPKLILSESANFPELVRFYRKEVVERGTGLIQRILTRGIERGEFRPIDPAHGAKLVMAPVLLSALWLTTFSHFEDKPLDVHGLLATHLDVLIAGLLQPRQDTPS